MGHFYTTVRGKGKDRREAEANAIEEFLYEAGNRHSVRDIKNAKLIATVPPMGVVRHEHGNEIHDYTQPNTDAPKKQWLQEWEFTLHTHA